MDVRHLIREELARTYRQYHALVIIHGAKENDAGLKAVQDRAAINLAKDHLKLAGRELAKTLTNLVPKDAEDAKALRTLLAWAGQDPPEFDADDKLGLEALYGQH